MEDEEFWKIIEEIFDENKPRKKNWHGGRSGKISWK